MNAIVPIIKPVSTACNITCGYCYHSWNRACQLNTMSDEILGRVLGEIAKLDQPMTRIIWHGGEPTLAGVPFFQKAVNVYAAASKERYVHSLQTNGTTINKAWVSFLKRSGFHVGISIDGPKELHNANRTFRNHQGTFDRVMRSVHDLLEAGVPTGVVCVVTKTNAAYAKEILDFFCTHGLTRLNFSPAADFDAEGSLRPYSLSPIEWGHFLVDLFDAWLEKDNPNIHVQLIDSFVSTLIGGEQLVCTCRQDCTNFLSFDNTGDVYFCGRMLGDADFKIGCVANAPLRDLLQSRKLSLIRNNVTTLNSACAVCSIKSFCGGGCPSHRFNVEHADFSCRYYFCESTRMIVNRIQSKLSRFLETSSTEEHLEKWRPA